MAIFAIRTTTGRETQVIDKMLARVEDKGLPVFSILKPREVKGYFFAESENQEELTKTIYGIQHAKGVVGGVKLEEIQHFLTPNTESIKIQVGDIVEIVSGPFRGEKATVKRITKVKEEVVVELLEAAVPIPITVKLDSVRVLKGDEEKN
jgi:transcriptional antiterminator NusG